MQGRGICGHIVGNDVAVDVGDENIGMHSFQERRVSKTHVDFGMAVGDYVFPCVGFGGGVNFDGGHT